MMSVISLANLPNLVLMGGVMWVGGKLAAQAWHYLGFDKKPRHKGKTHAQHEAEETPEEEEAEHEEEEENPEDEDEDEPDEEEIEPEDEPDEPTDPDDPNEDE
jgi:hypothetical protein